MKNLFITLAAVILFMLVGLYYTLLYPPSVMKRNTEKMLQQFSDTVETQDRAKVGAALSDVLSDDAKVHLEVTFSAISSANVRPMTQDFDKATFLTFIDNVLYTLIDYHTHPTLGDFALNNDVANVQFTSTQWADGPSFYQGVTLQMHFSGDMQCSGEVTFTDKQTKLRILNCAVLLRSVTKADSAGDMVNKAQQLHDLINQQQR